MDGRSIPLSAKDAAAFQKALTHYEAKEYEKSLAEVDAILQRRKEKAHGESLCLKGLVLYHLKRDEDGAAGRLIQEGTKADPKSHVAWHMAGIYHKLQHEYPEAYRAYLSSYRLKRDNPNVHQDLAMLAAQQRDYEMLVEVRRQNLAARMSLRMAWFALVAAQYLAGKYDGVEKTVSLYNQVMAIEQISQTADKSAQAKLAQDIERSELLMLQNQAFYKQGDVERALKDLDAIKGDVRDVLAWTEARALYLRELGRRSDAEAAYRGLVQRNPENAAYYEALEALVDDKTKLYAELAEQFPRSDMPRARPLVVLDADAAGYADRVEQYLAQKLARKVPSTFLLVKPLYADAAKRAVLQDVVERRLALPAKASDDAESAIFVVRHYSELGRHADAVALIDGVAAAGLDQDTQVDVQLARSEVLTAAGDLAGGARVLSEASDKLPGDRFLNTAAALAAFRANDTVEGYKLAFKFPIQGKHAETDQEALKYLVDLESVDVLVAAAEAHHRLREHGLALKRAMQVVNVFRSYYRDQYDFHYFGPHKGSLRAYVDVVKWEDDLFSHPVYERAVAVAVKEWVAVATQEDDGVSDKAKAHARQKRASKLDELDLKADADPFGIAELEAKDGLQRAYDAYKPLELATPGAVATWMLGFSIVLAQKKYVLANQALKRAKELGAPEWLVASGGLRARYTLEHDSAAPQVIRGLQLKMLPGIVSSGDVVNDDEVEFANKYLTDLVEWIRVRRFVGNTNGVEERVVESLPDLADVGTVEAAYNELQRAGLGAAFADAAKKAWPHATFF